MAQWNRFHDQGKNHAKSDLLRLMALAQGLQRHGGMTGAV